MFNKNIVEIKRFLKKYYIIILLCSLIIGGIASFLYVYNSSELSEIQDGTVEIQDGTVEIQETQTIKDYPQKYTNKNQASPAYFQFYVERLDGVAFNNSSTLQYLLTTDEVFEKVKDTTGVDMVKVKERSNGIESNKILPFKITVDEASNVFTAQINVGKETTNMRIAYFYHDYLLGPEFDFTTNNTIFNVVGPQIFNEKTDNVQVEQPTLEEGELVGEVNTRTLIVIGIIGSLIGVFLSTLVFVVKELSSTKLNFSFSYYFDHSDEFLLHDDKLDNSELIGHFIGIPYSEGKVILSERNLTKDIKNLMFNKIQDKVSFDKKEKNKMHIAIAHSLSDAPLNAKFNEIIILVQSTITTRKWLEEQLRYSEPYKIPIKIIQINSEKDNASQSTQ